MTTNALKVINLRPRNRTGGDCVCLALTFLTGASYMDVEAWIKDRHSKYQTVEGTRAYGVPTAKLVKNDEIIFGHKFVAIPNVYGIMISSFGQQFPVGKFLLQIPRHALSLHDDQVFCACDTPRRQQIERAWKVVKL